jgi:hypothetical protein
LERLEEMDKFLDISDHPKLNQEDINHLNRSITCNKVETSIKSGMSFLAPSWLLLNLTGANWG